MEKIMPDQLTCTELMQHRESFMFCSKCKKVDAAPHLYLFASKDIKKGEEVLLDYGDQPKTDVDLL